MIEYFNRHRVGHLTGWQMMSRRRRALPSVIWAFLWLKLADDKPAEASWIDPSEAAAVQDLLDREQKSIPTIANYLVAFQDSRVLLLCAVSHLEHRDLRVCDVAADDREGGDERGVGQSGLLTAIPYLLSCIVMYSVAAISDRQGRQGLRRPPLLLGR